MDTLSLDALKEMTALAQAPCLSLYQATHRSHPDNAQDRVHFRHGVEQLAASLGRAHTAADIKILLAPWEALARDDHFWNHTQDGLAVLACAGVFRVYVLPREMPSLAIVAESFHTKPLRRFLQSVDRYQVLCLTRNQAQLYEGNRHGLSEVVLAKEVPSTAAMALGDVFTEPQQTVSSHGGIGYGTSAKFHSTGGKKEEVDLDTVRYFRALDRALIAHHSRPGGLPLILACLTEHQHCFREVSRNSLLLPQGLEIHPQAMDLQALSRLAWAVVEPQHHARQEAWVEAFKRAQAANLGCVGLEEAARAAWEGRVGTLLIESERQVPGSLDVKTGGVMLSDLSDPAADDLLDDIGELVLSKGGIVHVVAAAHMPSTTGLAAIFRH